MDEILKKYQDQLDQAIKLSEKINRQKSYLVDLLIKDTSQASGVIINKYLDWLDENEVRNDREQLLAAANMLQDQAQKIEQLKEDISEYQQEIEQLRSDLEDCTCQSGHSEAYLKAKGKL